jgi:hypothetical protein
VIARPFAGPAPTVDPGGNEAARTGGAQQQIPIGGKTIEPRNEVGDRCIVLFGQRGNGIIPSPVN